MIEKGIANSSELIVGKEHCADHIGSGDLQVLSTPSMIALMENAALTAVAPHLPEGTTTVGGGISTSHLRPTKIGDKVRAEAIVTRHDGKKIEFDIKVYCGDELIGEGTHTRFIVDKEKFLSRLK